MKGLFTWFIVLLSAVFLFSNKDDIPYYWEGEKKHYYEIDAKMVLIEFTIDRIEEQNLKVEFPEAETYRIKNDSTIQLITSSKLSLLERLSDQGFWNNNLFG